MPDWKKEIEKRIGGLKLQATREAEIVEELSGDLQYMYDERRAQGASEEHAFQEVIRELDTGDLAAGLRDSIRTLQRDAVQDGATGRGNWIADLWEDLRYCARMIRKNPAFTTVAALTLALGIGANAAVFTIANTFLLNPLPVKDISTLIAVGGTGSGKGQQSEDLQLISFLNWKDMGKETESFSSFAAHSSPMSVTMTDTDQAHRVFIEVVSANYFQTLGLQPFAGRFFSPNDDAAPGASPVAVLGYGAWQSRFGGTPDILGRRIKLNGTVFTIIGIGPKGFKGVYAVFGPDLWAPLMMAKQILPTEQQNALDDRTLALLTGIGRLKPSTTLARVRAEMTTIGSILEREFPDANEGRGIGVETLAQAAFGPERQAVVLGTALLMAIVGVVLLIACSNVANLLLARAFVRRKELGVRMALGAGRGRLLRQSLTESVVLGLLAGVIGMFLAYVGCQLLMSLRPAEYAQNLADLKINANVYVFVFVVAILTGLIFGIAPALRSSNLSISETLKEERGTSGGRRGSFNLANILLAGQVATSLVLLSVAFLFLQSIDHEYTIDPGFDTKHLALFMLYPGQAGYDQTRTEQFYKQARERIDVIPGVSSVTWASNLPLWSRIQTGIAIEGREERQKSEAITAVVNTIDLNYFATLGIPLRTGRDFTAEDRDTSTPVAIINETMAEQYWAGQDALGKRLRLPGSKNLLKVVGVAKTADYGALGEPAQACVYVPLRQNYSGEMILYIRAVGDPSLLLSSVEEEIRAIDPGLPVEDVRTGARVVDQALWWSKIGVGMLGIFGLLALGLACVGLYGIVSYSVNQRRREIGVRMALGASRGVVTRFVLREGMRMVFAGTVIGGVLAFLAGRTLSHFLYGAGGAVPASLAGASALLIAVALGSCYLPARRASRVDPLVALREG